ncbi:hypothetical protein LCGC14_2841970, partial [marine sediment metagenome]
LESGQLTEKLSVEAERMVFVLKAARPWIPATKMRIILQGFDYDIPLPLIRHLYASYGWARGTKPYQEVNFRSLNLKVMQLCVLQIRSIARKSFLYAEDHLQGLLEVFRTLHARGVTKRYPGSRVSFGQHKEDFLSLGLLGLVERAQPTFRNSKVGFREEGRLILSKIQHPTRGQAYYQRILQSKKIEVDPTCVTKIFTRWKVNDFRSRFKGDLHRLLVPEAEAQGEEAAVRLPVAMAMRLDRGFVSFLKQLPSEPVALANPGIFLFLPYLDRLRIFDKAASLLDVDPDRGYSWFSLLLLSLGRVLQGLSIGARRDAAREPATRRVPDQHRVLQPARPERLRHIRPGTDPRPNRQDGEGRRHATPAATRTKMSLYVISKGRAGNVERMHRHLDADVTWVV